MAVINVVIVGAGALGRHVASILSKAKHNVILIDKDVKALQEAAAISDVATRQGSGTDWQILDDLLEFSPDLFIALTGNDEVNLVSCDIAKQLQYPRAIARIRDSRYLNQTRLDFGRLFDVDYFISPEVMIAHDILKYIISPGSLAIEHFAHGALQMRTLQIPDGWQEGGAPLRDFDLPGNLIVGLIARTMHDEKGELQTKIIFPHGDDVILPGDEVTFIGVADAISELHLFFNIPQKENHSVVIMGGSLTAINLTALLIERNIDVRIVDKSYERCCLLAEKFPEATVMNHDVTDLEFLRSEKVGQSDFVVTCTNSDEVNIMAALLAKEIGSNELVVMLSNPSYHSIVNKLGIKRSASPRVSATNQILSLLFSGRINSLVSLYENRAEIMEINVSLDSKIVGIPLSELGPFLPKDFLIVMIQNRGRIMIANGDKIVSPGDTVIVVTDPKHVPELEKIF